MLRCFAAIACCTLAVLCGCQTKAQPVPVEHRSGLTVDEPITRDNLTIWLLRGPDRSGGKTYLTLSEAMEQKKLIVHETGDVNELAVENVSDETVFIPAGSIVKGGQQDRTLGSDLIITLADGKVPIAAFCVEQGRWAQRGGEDKSAFSQARFMVSGKAMKLASNVATTQPSQGQVWQSVAALQQRLEHEVVAMGAGPGGLAENPGRGSAADAGRVSSAQASAVIAAESATSYQLSMETPAVRKLTEGRKAALIDAPAGRGDVVGYVYAVNNKIAGGNVYASPALFAKLWPMLLESAVVESIAESPTTQPTAAPPPLPTRADVAAALADRDKATTTRQLNARTTVHAYDRADSIMTDTLDQDGQFMCRTLLVK